MSWTRAELAKRSDEQISAIASRATNKLAKWRSVFAGWQLGTRADTDPECQAVRDHREATMILRAEVNALTACLVEAGVITARAFTEQVIIESEFLSGRYEQRFPGMKATDVGITYELPLAAETMKGWLP